MVHACLQKSTGALVAVTGVKMVPSVGIDACLPPNHWVMIEGDRGQRVLTCQLLRPAAIPERSTIVKHTEMGTVEGITDEVSVPEFKSLLHFIMLNFQVH